MRWCRDVMIGVGIKRYTVVVVLERKWLYKWKKDCGQDRASRSKIRRLGVCRLNETRNPSGWCTVWFYVMWRVTCKVRSVEKLVSAIRASRNNRKNHLVVSSLLCRCGKLYDNELGKGKKRKAKRGKTGMTSVWEKLIADTVDIAQMTLCGEKKKVPVVCEQAGCSVWG